jgi:hypothetical protein
MVYFRVDDINCHLDIVEPRGLWSYSIQLCLKVEVVH